MESVANTIDLSVEMWGLSQVKDHPPVSLAYSFQDQNMVFEETYLSGGDMQPPELQ